MGDTRKARLMRRSSLAQLALDGTTVDLSIFFLDESDIQVAIASRALVRHVAVRVAAMLNLKHDQDYALFTQRTVDGLFCLLNDEVALASVLAQCAGGAWKIYYRRWFYHPQSLTVIEERATTAKTTSVGAHLLAFADAKTNFVAGHIVAPRQKALLLAALLLVTDLRHVGDAGSRPPRGFVCVAPNTAPVAVTSRSFRSFLAPRLELYLPTRTIAALGGGSGSSSPTRARRMSGSAGVRSLRRGLSNLVVAPKRAAIVKDISDRYLDLFVRAGMLTFEAQSRFLLVARDLPGYGAYFQSGIAVELHVVGSPKSRSDGLLASSVLDGLIGSVVGIGCHGLHLNLSRPPRTRQRRISLGGSGGAKRRTSLTSEVALEGGGGDGSGDVGSSSSATAPPRRRRRSSLTDVVRDAVSDSGDVLRGKGKSKEAPEETYFFPFTSRDDWIEPCDENEHTLTYTTYPAELPGTGALHIVLRGRAPTISDEDAAAGRSGLSVRRGRGAAVHQIARMLTKVKSAFLEMEHAIAGHVVAPRRRSLRVHDAEVEGAIPSRHRPPPPQSTPPNRHRGDDASELRRRQSLASAIPNTRDEGDAVHGPSITSKWYYHDDSGEVRGPFEFERMVTWVTKGYFAAEMLVAEYSSMAMLVNGVRTTVDPSVDDFSELDWRPIGGASIWVDAMCSVPSSVLDGEQVQQADRVSGEAAADDSAARTAGTGAEAEAEAGTVAGEEDGKDLETDADLIELGWSQHNDPSTKRVYYYHSERGVVQWDRPGDAPRRHRRASLMRLHVIEKVRNAVCVCVYVREEDAVAYISPPPSLSL